MKNSILSISNISKSYKNHQALREVSFVVPKGAVFGLIGPNGAGKSTLIRVLVGIYNADAGEIRYHNQEVRQIPFSAVGYLPEERGLYRKMRVEEHLVYLARLRGVSKTEAKQRAIQWLERMKLADWKNHDIAQLSKGMQQKIQFICAVIHNPEIVILDEPFSGFDPVNAEEMKKEIFRLNKEEGKTFIFSTHRMENAEEMCSHIAMIHQSELRLLGTIDEVKAGFEHDFYWVESRKEIKDLASYKEKKTKEVLCYRVPGAVVRSVNLLQNEAVISVKRDRPSLHEVFLNIVRNE